MSHRNELAANLEVVFALAPQVVGVLLLATLAVAALPILIVVASAAVVALLAVAAWREMVPAGREAANYAALAELWSAVVAFDRRSRRDFNRLVSDGNWAAFVGETRRPVCRPAAAPVAVEQTDETPVAPVAATAPAPLPLVFAVRTLPLLAYRPAPVLTVDAVRSLSRQSVPVAPSMADTLRLDTYPADAFTQEQLDVVAVLPLAPTVKRTRKPAATRKPRVATVKAKPAPKVRSKAPLDDALAIIEAAKVKPMPAAARETPPDAPPAPKRTSRASKPADVLSGIRTQTPAQLVARLRRASGGRDYIATAKASGVATDGRLLLVMTDALRSKLPEEQTAGRPVPQRTIDELIGSNHMIAPAALGTLTGTGAEATLALVSGRHTVQVNARDAALIRRHYPTATYHLGAGRTPGDRPVVAKAGETVVGLLVPIVAPAK